MEQRLEKKLSKAEKELQDFMSKKFIPTRNKKQELEKRIKNIKYKMKTLERRKRRREETKIKKEISDLKTLRQLIIEGRGKVGDFLYFVSSGKKVGLRGISIEVKPRSFVNENSFSKIKKAYEKGLKVGHWLSKEEEIYVYFESGRSSCRKFDEIFSKPKSNEVIK